MVFPEAVVVVPNGKFVVRGMIGVPWLVVAVVVVVAVAVVLFPADTNPRCNGIVVLPFERDDEDCRDNIIIVATIMSGTNTLCCIFATYTADCLLSFRVLFNFIDYVAGHDATSVAQNFASNCWI